MGSNLFWFAIIFALCESLKTVYVVPHSHCDPGWIEPIDYYYDNKVVKILPNVVQLLDGYPDRKFAWSETSFFSRWYESSDEHMQKKVQRLVQKGQLEFVGGGWVQHDEALNDLDTITLQLEIGHTWLKNTFGISVPRTAWQLDPFGYSSISPSLFTNFGYEYLVINRIEEDFKTKMREEQALQFIWQGSDLGQGPGMLTYALNEHYDTPLIIRRKNSPEYCFNGRGDVAAKVENCSKKLQTLLEDWAIGYNSDKLMLLYGDDFDYDNMGFAQTDIENMEKIMSYMRENMNIDIKFGTPSEFFDDLAQSKPTLKYYTGEFFPYANRKGTPTKVYWTGFYATRPQFKQHIAESWKLNRAANIMSGLVLHENYNREEVAYTLHHDAITGTCRPHVIKDYEHKMNNAATNAYAMMSRAVATFPETNVLGNERHVTFYNPLNRERTELLSIKVQRAFIEIQYQGQVVASQAVIDEKDVQIFFRATLPGLSLTTFTIIEHTDECDSCAFVSQPAKDFSTVKTEDLEVQLDDSGFIKKVEFDGKLYEVDEKYVKYGSTNRSGAYIFMPPSEYKVVELNLKTITVQEGPLLTLVTSKHQRAKDDREYLHQLLIPNKGTKIKLTTRIFALENEEVMISLFTDERLRDFYTFNSVDVRQWNYEETPISSLGKNFQPIAGGLLVGDPKASVFITPDYPFGAGNLENETLLHIHRYINQDDDWGLAYKLEDREETMQSFWFHFGETNQDTLWENYLLHHTPVVALNDVGEEEVSIEPYSWQRSPTSWTRDPQVIIGESDNKVYLSSVKIQDEMLHYRVKSLANSPVNCKFAENAQRFKLGGYDRFETRSEMFETPKKFCWEASCSNGNVVNLQNGLMSSDDSYGTGVTLSKGEFISLAIPLSDAPQAKSSSGTSGIAHDGLRNATAEQPQEEPLVNTMLADQEKAEQVLREMLQAKPVDQETVIDETTEDSPLVHELPKYQNEDQPKVTQMLDQQAVDPQVAHLLEEDIEIANSVDEASESRTIELNEEEPPMEGFHKIEKPWEADDFHKADEMAAQNDEYEPPTKASDDIQKPWEAYGANLMEAEQQRIQEKIKEIQERNKETGGIHTEEPWDIRADNPEAIHERIFNRISEAAATKAQAEQELEEPEQQNEPEIEAENSENQPMVPIPDTGVTDFPEKRFLDKIEAPKPVPATPKAANTVEVPTGQSPVSVDMNPGMATQDDIQILFYLLVLCLSIIALVTIAMYFRIKKQRKD